jgi:N-acetylglucosaminyldiphosphoundecaprenol N-acetyl-beta-D-mannosaminyltransferase
VIPKAVTSTSEGLPALAGSPAPRVNILGVGVSAINTTIAIETIARWIADKDPHYVCVSGVHGVMECQRDEHLRRIHNRAGLVTPDGMPLVWLSRMKGHPEVDRVYGPDLMLDCGQVSVARGYRHYFYGGQEGVPELLAQRLQHRFPGLSVVGCHSPPFGEVPAAEDEAIVRRINESEADIVWVGLSTPKQERWMYDHRSRIRAPVLIGVGAAFDFNAGLKRQAPRWMGRSGLEWLFRLAMEPRRLWRRYLVNNPLFLGYLLLQVLQADKYEAMRRRDTEIPVE